VRGIARLNDRTFGICNDPRHGPIEIGGRIITGSNDVSVDGRPVARINDLVATDCGHYDYIIGYRKDVFGNVREFARLNDQVGKKGVYIAKIITASGKASTL
jgi:hypothetical protein